MSNIKDEVFALLEFGEPKKVATKQGDRLLSVASPNNEFWDLWADEKAAIKAAGFSCSKNKKSGEWEVCHWQALQEAVFPTTQKKEQFDDDDIPF